MDSSRDELKMRSDTCKGIATMTIFVVVAVVCVCVAA